MVTRNAHQDGAAGGLFDLLIHRRRGHKGGVCQQVMRALEGWQALRSRDSVNDD